MVITVLLYKLYSDNYLMNVALALSLIFMFVFVCRSLGSSVFFYARLIFNVHELTPLLLQCLSDSF